MNGNRNTDPQSTVSPASSDVRFAEPKGHSRLTGPSNGHHHGMSGSRPVGVNVPVNSQ